MKKMRIKVTAAALASMMALAATGCTLNLSGDAADMLSSVADNVEIVVNSEKADPAEGAVKDASRETSEEQDATAQQETTEITSETQPEVIETQVPTENPETAPKQKETKAPKTNETKVPKTTEAPKATEAPKETEAPATTPEQEQPKETEAPKAPSELDLKYCFAAYEPYVKAYLDENGHGIYKVKFSFLNLDGDGYPELVIADKRYVDNASELKVYTYKDGKVVSAMDNIYSGQGAYYYYKPNQNTIYYLVQYNDCYASPTKFTLEDLVANKSGKSVDEEIVNYGYPLEGYIDALTAWDYLAKGYVPTDDQFYKKGEGYQPDRKYGFSDYEKYNANYRNLSDTVHFTFYGPTNNNNDEAQITLWVNRTAYMGQVRIPMDGNVGVFYYQGYTDSNWNSRRDSGESYYRKCTIELLDDGIKMTFEECNARDIDSRYDLSSEFVGGEFIREETYFFTFADRY
ncbi:MAG: hypothetical protein J6Y58_04920 [Clostridiales bacterium]|nr:hypothetical protein [Clostridiales bacterium]